MTREEAIKIANEMYGWLKTDREKEALETLVPELRESEDERIRKELIEFIREAYSTGNAPEKCAKWLVWLDLQKEQKPLIKKGVWKPSHNTLPIEQQVEAAIEKQVEAAMIAIRGEMPSKSQEWSEDDEDHLKAIIRIIEDNDSDWKELTDWLKSFPERLSLQPKQEWSEEDEKIIDTIVSVLGQYIDYKAVSGTGTGYATPRYSKEIDWLKSLHPQPHWKPSKEQMEALFTVLEHEAEREGHSKALEIANGFYDKLKN